MNPYDFASKHFGGNYKKHGNEIIPKYCPYCNGGPKHDQKTFALNVDRLTFNCKRGSCGRQGTFWQLCQDFGEVADIDKNFEYKAPAPKPFIKPSSKPKTPGEKVEAYLKLRGFSKPTWEVRKVSEDNGNIAFPYYENGELVLMKFRKPEKYNGQGQKAWREKGGKAVPWGMDDCVFNLPLVITEGEFDALALSECTVDNVVSVPSGSEDLTWVDNCWDWLQKFNKVIIWPDNDIPGQEMARKLIVKLGAWRCYTVSVNYKDANEMMARAGKVAVKEAFNNAKEVPIAGLIRLAEVKAFDLDNIVRVKSSIQAINEVIGGYMMGQVSIWTGVNSSGKSTFIGQELISTISQGLSVCAYSGELPGPIFRYWIELQAAGPYHLTYKDDPIRNAQIAYPSKEAQEAMRNWYRDKFFLYDSLGGLTADNLIEVFEYAAMRYDCKVFLVDNLMTAIISGDKDNYYRKQSEFIGKMVDFSHRFDVHVHIVAHPRKADGRLTKMDVAGSGDITNRADNVFSVYRLTDDETNEKDYHSTIDVFKNRYSGRQDVEIQLLFDEDCKRFTMHNRPDWNVKFGWEKAILSR